MIIKKMENIYYEKKVQKLGYLKLKRIDPDQWKLSTYQTMVVGFAGLILFGALLLMLPVASNTGQPLSFLDAIFTATSAVCVTGLVVVDTGTRFSLFGQTVIILLIQLGGLGIMTVTTLLAVAAKRKIDLKERLLIQEAMNQLSLSGVVRLALYVMKVTLLIEFVGGTILAIRFYQDFGEKGIYYGYWHSISAFCNAGFDLFGGFRSLTLYVDDVTVNMVIASLIILGGIGFTVIADVWKVRNLSRCSFHTKVVVWTSGILILIGTVVIVIAEYNNITIKELDFSSKVLAGFFQSVSARTAGYNSIDIGDMRDGTLFIVIILMFIGASPASTGGGIKTSTAAILVMSLVGLFTGKEEPELFYRQIPHRTIQKAFMIFLISALLVVAVTILMTFTEDASFIRILFEVTSAFGTVGLSTGLTPDLSPIGKVLIILTMFAGRVGTMTLILAVASKQHKQLVEYPTGKIIIG